MKAILNLFWQICLLRQSPAHVPTPTWFVTSVVAANLLGSVAVSRGFAADATWLELVTSIIVGQTTTAALVGLGLSLRNLGSRFLTTITAIFGCDLIITVCFSLVLPLGALLGQFTLTLASVAFLIWSVAVAGFILHRALDVQYLFGIGIAMGISLFSATASQLAVAA